MSQEAALGLGQQCMWIAAQIAASMSKEGAMMPGPGASMPIHTMRFSSMNMLRTAALLPSRLSV